MSLSVHLQKVEQKILLTNKAQHKILKSPAMDRIERIREMLAQQPQDPFLQHALALEWVKLGDDVQAETGFKALLEQHPDYLGSYYHLGKLHERNGRIEMAIDWYLKGIRVAEQQGDRHALNELRSAHEEISF